MRGRRNGSMNYYYFHAHQCSLAHRHSTLFCFIYHPIWMEGNIKCCASAYSYTKIYRITYVNAITLCVLHSVSLSQCIFSHKIHSNQCGRHMMTKFRWCICDVHSSCSRHNDARSNVINKYTGKAYAKTHTQTYASKHTNIRIYIVILWTENREMRLIERMS